MSIVPYRPYIDGLRAIAVISVLLFHFHKSLLQGGFVGVDVFFVISGYLITSIIVSECENGQFSFLRFYQRRISRIFPVFFLVSITTLITASILYSAQDFASAGAVAIAASLSIANLKLMFQGNYFQLSPDAQPLLHFWSLSIEEQFYLVFPLVIYLAFQMKITRQKLLIALFLMTLLSFSMCAVLTAKNPTWAFYLLPTRAWELLAGCLLAIYQGTDCGSIQSTTNNQQSQEILSNVGLILIIVSFVVINEATPFPGFMAALPVLGTVLLIGACQWEESLPKKVLSHPFLLLVGKMSYSLYLWHWSIYSFVDYSLYLQSFSTRAILKVFLTIFLSTLSYFWLEKPTRSYLNKPKKALINFAIFASGVITLVAVGLFISTNNYINPNANSIKDGGVAFNSNISKPVVVLMGDSNGAMYGRTMKEIAEEMSVRTNVISIAAGDPFPDAPLYKNSLLFLGRENPEITIFVAAWAQKIGNDKERFETALKNILQKSKHVILIAQPPNLPNNIYSSRQGIRDFGQRPIFEDIEFTNLRKTTNTFLLSHRNDRVHVLDINNLFEQPNGEIRFTNVQGKQIYQDSGHLSSYGSQMVKKLIKEEIAQILG